jgi:hypothetical protein
MEEKRNDYRLLVGKRTLGRSRRRWMDNITMNLLELGCDDVNRLGRAGELL